MCPWRKVISDAWINNVILLITQLQAGNPPNKISLLTEATQTPALRMFTPEDWELGGYTGVSKALPFNHGAWEK